MNPDKRQELEQRRRQMQTKQAAQAFVDSHVAPVLDILDLLQRLQVAAEVVQVMHVQDDWLPTVHDVIAQDSYAKRGFAITHLEERGMTETLEKLEEAFPSVNSLRYVPDLPKLGDYSAGFSKGCLQRIVQELALPDQYVYFYYLRYAVVLRVPLFALAAQEHEDLFNFWHGDVLVFPDTLDWLISFSLEEEWYGGFSG